MGKKRKKDFGDITPREFELLVSRIENAYVSKDAVIKSPDFILDKVSGSMREVDISIRFKQGTSEHLVVVECRKRNSPQDTTWMEQLSKKRDAIGATKMIAVTSSKFYKPTIKAARFYNIDLRKLSNITENAIEGFVKLVKTDFNVALEAIQFSV